MDGKSYLAVENLSLTLGQSLILHEITLEISQGEIVALIGPNGAGKSSLIKCILGFLPFQRGEISFLGQSLAHREVRQRFLAKVGYVPQFIDFDRETPMTVRELLAASSKIKREDAFLGAVSEVGAQEYLDQRLGSLSGGQLQRVMIALGLLKKPEILFLDEPSSGIDIHGQEIFYDLLRRVQKERNLTVVLVSHDIGVVSTVASRVICINQTLRCSGPPRLILTPENIKEIYNAESSLYIHHHDHGEKRQHHYLKRP